MYVLLSEKFHEQVLRRATHKIGRRKYMFPENRTGSRLIPTSFVCDVKLIFPRSKRSQLGFKLTCALLLNLLSQ